MILPNQTTKPIGSVPDGIKGYSMFGVYDAGIYRSSRVIPRANNHTIYSNEYIEKTKALLAEFGQIPLVNFAVFWDVKYNEIIDFVDLKYDGGLKGFLNDSCHLFDVSTDEDGFLAVSLISRPVSRFSSDPGVSEDHLTQESLWRAMYKQRSIDRTVDKLFNEMNYLWADRPWRKFLQKKNIMIATSAYESALDCHHEKTLNVIGRIKEVLEMYPEGMPVNQLYKHIRISRALRVFNVSISASSLIDELPELFFRQKSENPEEDLIFDGELHSVEDLTGQDLSLYADDREPESIVTDAINKGLYQKTLILIRETGQVKGMKVNVWMKSLKLNFYNKNEDAFEEDLKSVHTLTFFLALARYNLIELRSQGRIKNDIQAFLPRKYVRYLDLKTMLPKLKDFRGNVTDEENAGITDDPYRTDADGENEKYKHLETKNNWGEAVHRLAVNPSLRRLPPAGNSPNPTKIEDKNADACDEW